jgi:membrane fusion protein (multidrug efflux system)
VIKRISVIAIILLAVLAGAAIYIGRNGGSFGPLGSVVAWVQGQTSRAPAPAAPPQPPPEVPVMEVRKAEIPYPVEFAGRVVSFRDVEVRPRVSGLLLSREYEEGTKVTAGQVLFRIDPATYQVALDRAEAQLAQAKAALTQAENNYDRIEELARRQVTTASQREEALSARDQGRANVQLAQAEVASARLNLSYTTVTAPVAGVTALQSPPIGTLIQAQQTLLTTVNQLDPTYVSFSFTEGEGQAFRELNQRRAKPISEQDLTVELHFGNGTTYPQTGKVDISAMRVDPQTGTIEARAIFPNPDAALLPGQFVRVIVRGITLPDALVVPNRAVSQGPQGPSVFVVRDNNIAQAKLIRLGAQVASGWVIDSGLQDGDRVIVDGVIRVRPGAPVRPVPAPSSQVGAAENQGKDQGPQKATDTTGATGAPAPGTRP